MQIAELWRFPVKSMQGESVSTVGVAADGLHGDRGWSVLDTTRGKTLTCRREPRLLFASARLDGDEVVITLPDNSETSGDDANDALSAWLGFDVALVKANDDGVGTYEIQLDFETEVGDWHEWQGPTGSFHDSTKTKVSLVGRETLGAWDQRRFRTNIVLTGLGAREEDALVGQELRAGDDLALDVTKQIDRCIVTTRPQPGGLDRDLDVLRTINRDHASLLGIGSLVRTPGSISVGDEVRVG